MKKKRAAGATGDNGGEEMNSLRKEGRLTECVFLKVPLKPEASIAHSSLQKSKADSAIYLGPHREGLHAMASGVLG